MINYRLLTTNNFFKHFSNLCTAHNTWHAQKHHTSPRTVSLQERDIHQNWCFQTGNGLLESEEKKNMKEEYSLT